MTQQRQLSEHEQVRRESLQKIREAGIDPYPAESFDVNVTAESIHQHYHRRKMDYKTVSIAGRLTARRIMGKASFADLQDETGEIQLFLKRDDLCPDEDKTMYNKLFKKWLDIGDIIGVKGYVFTTNTGQLSIHVNELKLLSKSLRPLPIVKESDEKKHDAFTDPEQRYRQRYVDLIVNPEVRDIFRKRAKLIEVMREYMNNWGCLEVETPILQPLYGGASARPFKTHHHTLDTVLYMRIANELYLKRLLVGGFRGVFEFAKDFRNEGMDRQHNPEFTQMEMYYAYKDYEWMMERTEEMIEQVALSLHGDTKVTYEGHEIDFQRPWQRYTMYEAIEKFTGFDISGMEEKELRKVARQLDIEIEESMGKGKIIDEIFGEKCEPELIQPTFITDYPIEMSPLAKKHRSKEGLVERFEVICAGSEISNAFSELNDPLEQRKRFQKQLQLAERGDEEAMQLDEDFLRALEYGMPPSAGLGIGIDRLTMIMTGQTSIQEVIFFPQMRPEQKKDTPSATSQKDATQ